MRKNQNNGQATPDGDSEHAPSQGAPAVNTSPEAPAEEHPHHTLPLKEDADALTIVGLGGSAGSIPALEAFFQNVSPTSGSAYVVVLHLSPDHASLLPEVLGRSSTIPIEQVT